MVSATDLGREGGGQPDKMLAAETSDRLVIHPETGNALHTKDKVVHYY